MQDDLIEPLEIIAAADLCQRELWPQDKHLARPDLTESRHRYRDCLIICRVDEENRFSAVHAEHCKTTVFKAHDRGNRHFPKFIRRRMNQRRLHLVCL